MDGRNSVFGPKSNWSEVDNTLNLKKKDEKQAAP